MKRQMMRLLTMFLLAGILLVDHETINAEPIEEAETAEEVLPTGLMPREVIEIPDVDEEAVYDVGEEDISITSALYEAQVYNNEWDKYKNYYAYNQMTEEERRYWDALDEVCLHYMITQDSPESYERGSSTIYYTELVANSELTAEQAQQVIWIFKYENPQYYFLNNSILTANQNGTIYYGFGIYSAFADGAARATATNEVKAKVSEWQNQVDASDGTEAEKVKLIHDLIVNKVDYNEGIYEEGFDEDKQYSQSSYSVFCTDYTVCAGYSLAFAMLCNASGIDAITVTSLEHAWNKVRINDSWYNIDVTWADQGAIYYEYYERSDRYYDTVDDYSARMHAEEDMWTTYLPLCTLDAVGNGDYTAPGVLPEITQTTAQPQISMSRSGGGYTIDITCDTTGADIYYTLDGTVPAPASTKSYLYQGAFSTESSQIKAVAVHDMYWDSEIKTGAPAADAGGETVDDDVSAQNGLVERNGKYYFYEGGVMAASKEAYVDGAWRWFDADGSMAVSKDVYQTSSGGKWVRYNENGEMIKGEDYRYGGWYYFEPITGTMMKGPVVLDDGRKVFYDEVTGQMVKGRRNIGGENYVFDEMDGHLISGKDHLIWVMVDGKKYWYEHWQRQGWDPANGAYRGKEVYDPASDAWFWLDNVQQGAMAAGKDVYQESSGGKWVRYDGNGAMIKGWETNENGTYYFDLITGAMAKGWNHIDGVDYYFDETTGIRW